MTCVKLHIAALTLAAALGASVSGSAAAPITAASIGDSANASAPLVQNVWGNDGYCGRRSYYGGYRPYYRPRPYYYGGYRPYYNGGHRPYYGYRRYYNGNCGYGCGYGRDYGRDYDY
jgi:hypothetical protein